MTQTTALIPTAHTNTCADARSASAWPARQHSAPIGQPSPFKAQTLPVYTPPLPQPSTQRSPNVGEIATARDRTRHQPIARSNH